MQQIIGIKQVLQHLEDGLSRDEIAEHYNITKAECKNMFKHPQLLGKKTKKKPSFRLVDDATLNIEVIQPELVKAENLKIEKDVEEFIKDETLSVPVVAEEVEEPVVVEQAAWGETRLPVETEEEDDAEEPESVPEVEETVEEVEAESEPEEEKEIPTIAEEQAKAEW
jgi:hypothetical protein